MALDKVFKRCYLIRKCRLTVELNPVEFEIKGVFEQPVSKFVEQYKANHLGIITLLQEPVGSPSEYHRRIIHGKTADAGSKRRDAERSNLCSTGIFEAVDKCDFNRFLGGSFSKMHSRGVQDKLRLKVASPCHSDVTELHWFVIVAFLNDRRTALAPNRSGDASAQNQFSVGSVDDCIDILLSNVALDDLYSIECSHRICPFELER